MATKRRLYSLPRLGPRLQPPTHRFVYHIYEIDTGRLMYVGVTCNPRQRWESHRGGAYRGGKYRFDVVTDLLPVAEAGRREAHDIRTLKPADNLYGWDYCIYGDRRDIVTPILNEDHWT